MSTTSTAAPFLTAPSDRVWLAEEYLRQREPGQAVAILEPTHVEQPDDRAVATALARAYFHTAQLERAREVAARIVERTPDDTYARILLARTLERQSRLAEAVPHLRLALAMTGDPDVGERLAGLERRLAG